MAETGHIQQCTRCILSSGDAEDIRFDQNGVCNYCASYDTLHKNVVPVGNKAQRLEALIEQIKTAGKGKEYDCIIGVSGGVDSTYVAWLSKQKGLRPLAVHLDYGWNSELAVANINATLTKLGIDLYTHVVDWEEIKDLQLAFLKASVVDIELLNDFAIFALLYNEAFKRGIKYVLHGMNVETEGGRLPKGWTHEKFDQLNILSIHKQFGSKKLKTYPRLSFFKRFYLNTVYKLKWEGILNYIDYNKDEVKERIIKELGWRDYGGKHFESIFTRFYQAYILPRKFKIDKRKFHYSVLICSGQLTRQAALDLMQQPIYDPKLFEQDYAFVLKKLGLTRSEFEALMDEAPKKHLDYPSYLTRHYKYNALFFKSIKPLTSLAKKILRR